MERNESNAPKWLIFGFFSFNDIRIRMWKGFEMVRRKAITAAAAAKKENCLPLNINNFALTLITSSKIFPNYGSSHSLPVSFSLSFFIRLCKFSSCRIHALLHIPSHKLYSRLRAKKVSFIRSFVSSGAIQSWEFWLLMMMRLAWWVMLCEAWKEEWEDSWIFFDILMALLGSESGGGAIINLHVLKVSTLNSASKCSYTVCHVKEEAWQER